MKLVNYDIHYLILQKIKKEENRYPGTFTNCQYRILCKIIIRKKNNKGVFLLSVVGIVWINKMERNGLQTDV